MMSISSSEVALRLLPVLAGSLFPWVVFRWLARTWNQGAGLAALLILTFSPNLVMLSAQARAYTLALLFAALALLFLEEALQRASLLYMLLFTGALYLAILSEYSAAWFAGAAGIYFLLRIRSSGVSRPLAAVWALGQAGTLAIYAALYWTSAHVLLADPRRAPLLGGFLRGAFPQAGESLLRFSVLGTLRQFAYTFASIPLGLIAALLFAGGLVLLWRGRSAAERTRSRALAALLVVPFLLACAGAALELHPYGRSRHTVILSLFIAAAVGVALERLLRSRAWVAALAAVVLLPVWGLAAQEDRNNIPRNRSRRSSMIAALAHLRAAVPPGSLILTTRQTELMLRYYLGDPQVQASRWPPGVPAQAPLGPYRALLVHWEFGTGHRFLEDLATVRREFSLGPSEPLWVVEGGFDFGLHSRPRDRNLELQLPGLRDFDGALVVFRTPPGL
jgi:hypothetical protein